MLILCRSHFDLYTRQDFKGLFIFPSMNLLEDMIDQEHDYSKSAVEAALSHLGESVVWRSCYRVRANIYLWHPGANRLRMLTFFPSRATIAREHGILVIIMHLRCH